jgi:hypothetical protein
MNPHVPPLLWFFTEFRGPHHGRQFRPPASALMMGYPLLGRKYGSSRARLNRHVAGYPAADPANRRRTFVIGKSQIEPANGGGFVFRLPPRLARNKGPGNKN